LLVADFTLGDALLTTLWVFLFVAWIMVLFSIIGDLFRDHSLSGWAKAIWILFLIFVPFVTALVYLIARGEGMRERSVREQAEARKHLESYIRETAGSSPVDELHKLSELRDKGAITDEEFQRMKAKLVG
jgi:ABC-type multidrug transport system fused ATPase/permease subunit